MTPARGVALPATRRPQSRGYLAAGLAAVVRRSHPYLETPASAAAVHDLYRRLGPDDDPAAVLAADIVDAAAPVASLAAGSQIVALAREAAAAGEGRWTPDDDEPEASFAALVERHCGCVPERRISGIVCADDVGCLSPGLVSSLAAAPC